MLCFSSPSSSSLSLFSSSLPNYRDEILARHAREKAEIAAILESVALESFVFLSPRWMFFSLISPDNVFAEEEKQEFIDQEFNTEKEEITSKHTEVYHYLKVQLETEIVDYKEKLLSVSALRFVNCLCLIHSFLVTHFFPFKFSGTRAQQQHHSRTHEPL